MFDEIVSFAPKLRQFKLEITTALAWLSGRVPSSDPIFQLMEKLLETVGYDQSKAVSVYHKMVTAEQFEKNHHIFYDYSKHTSALLLSARPTDPALEKPRPLPSDIIEIRRVLNNWLDLDVPKILTFEKSDKEIVELLDILQPDRDSTQPAK
ncbi:hypothetical protein AB9F29_12855 [Falsihalocynthiibacter sp. S25ZX9]|uniref:hypothetical protein n=1 Tax=Falsihalocynthiibacter sp. S25ZX9 TaxID=3240870 RepID=UPI00350EDA66